MKRLIFLCPIIFFSTLIAEETENTPPDLPDNTESVCNIDTPPAPEESVSSTSDEIIDMNLNFVSQELTAINNRDLERYEQERNNISFVNQFETKSSDAFTDKRTDRVLN